MDWADLRRKGIQSKLGLITGFQRGRRRILRRALFLFLLIATSFRSVQAQQGVSQDLYRRYFNHPVQLRMDIPHTKRAAVLDSGRLDVSPIDALSRLQGAFSPAGRTYVIGAIDVRPSEVEFTIYSFLSLPTPGFNPGNSIDWDGRRTVQSRGYTLASPVASIVLKYDQPSDLAFDKVNKALDPLVTLDPKGRRLVRRLRRP
jgi:hypothetical protein